ncbi:phosphatidic acid phosphatase type 2/haloperoxidase [Neocallimastix lanati (nom. inval.)]|jgi:diacylglycerol diphosphate phosphatase/phosphatidate phosphatase|nr:phosphatidic acid phosphatase type 2/haloperoxidase [Neocallimastix sp. JGI-2020a]
MAQEKLSGSVKKTTLLLDWIFIVILFVAMIIVGKFSLNERQFSLDDVSISLPHKGDTVNMVLLVIFSCVSLTIIIGFQFYKKRMNYDLHQAIIGLIVSSFISVIIGNIIKCLSGRYRPDFLSLCQVDFSKVEEQYKLYNISSSINYGQRNLFNTSICTAPKEQIRKGMRSFPSGHSYAAFNLMSYLAFYIAGQIHLFDGKCYLWKYCVVIIPFIISTAIALSRVFDNRHHWEDVLVGSLMGLIIGTFTYFYYYPSLKDKNCDIPYQNRKIIEKIDIDKQGDYYASERVDHRNNERMDTRNNERFDNRNNERMDTRNNERFDNRINERMNNRNNERLDNRNNERMNNRNNERFDNRNNERMNNRGNERFDNRNNERMNNRGNERFDNRNNERMNNRNNERMNNRNNERFDNRNNERFDNRNNERMNNSNNERFDNRGYEKFDNRGNERVDTRNNNIRDYY